MKFIKRLLADVVSLVSFLVVLLIIFCCVWLYFGWTAFGQIPDSDYQHEYLRASPQWVGGQFKNAETSPQEWTSFLRYALGQNGSVPADMVPQKKVSDTAIYQQKNSSGLRFTWLGHSTLLLEMDKANVLIDPCFSKRTSPVDFIGPRWGYESPLSLENLPTIDMVLISHDHYEQLDYATIKQLIKWQVTFVVPLGVGRHLRYWGIPEDRIVELDWWGRVVLNGITVAATPARHGSGRLGVVGADKTLWSGFAISGKKHRVWYSGDSGFTSAFHEVGQKFGPFDLAFVDVGGPDNLWANWHMNVGEAVEAGKAVGSKAVVGVHGAFAVEKELKAAGAAGGVNVLVPQMGAAMEFKNGKVAGF